MTKILASVILSLFFAVNLFAQEVPKKPKLEHQYTYNSDQQVQTKTTLTYDSAGNIVEKTIVEYGYFETKVSNEKTTTVGMTNGVETSKQVTENRYNPMTNELTKSFFDKYDLFKSELKIVFKKIDDPSEKTLTSSIYQYDASGILTQTEEYNYEYASGKKVLNIYTITKYVLRRNQTYMQEENIYSYSYDDNGKISQVKFDLTDLDNDITGSRYYVFNEDGSTKSVEFQGKGIKVSKAEQEAQAKLILEIPARVLAY